MLVRFNEIADTSPLDALAGTIHTHPQSDTPAEIADPSLRAAVQAALGLGSSQAPTIGHLAALTGLQHLYLRNNPATDLAPLNGLTELTIHQ